MNKYDDEEPVETDVLIDSASNSSPSDCYTVIEVTVTDYDEEMARDGRVQRNEGEARERRAQRSQWETKEYGTQRKEGVVMSDNMPSPTDTVLRRVMSCEVDDEETIIAGAPSPIPRLSSLEMLARPSLAQILLPNFGDPKIKLFHEQNANNVCNNNAERAEKGDAADIDDTTDEGDGKRSKFIRMANKRMHDAMKRGKKIAGRAHEASLRRVENLRKKPPLCFLIMNRAYHKYGLKHLVLILVFMFYTAFGAFVFLIIEGPEQGSMRDLWRERIRRNRTVVVKEMMKQVFNNSDFLIYIKGNTSDRLREHFDSVFSAYETQLGIRWSEQRLEWDYWNALLFAGTICTTIGYGHIYPITTAGKILTMVYALFGIPLMLLVLQDLGKMLTITMKYPWFQFKRLARRVMRCCTKQSLKEMKQIEIQERRDLEVFDLPLPVGVSLIVLWVWLCSIVMTLWDKNWTLLEAFYFFFISLSTVGLGDLVPSDTQLLVTMFGFILIGLSLVSMVINLLQTKMRKTYEAGKEVGETEATTLGVLQVFEDRDPHVGYMPVSQIEETLSRSTQTSLSLPSTKQCVLRSDGVHWQEESPPKSPDEVTRLVEMENSLHVCQDIGEHMLENEDNFDNTYSLQSYEIEPLEPDDLILTDGSEA